MDLETTQKVLKIISDFGVCAIAVLFVIIKINPTLDRMVVVLDRIQRHLDKQDGLKEK